MNRLIESRLLLMSGPASLTRAVNPARTCQCQESVAPGGLSQATTHLRENARPGPIGGMQDTYLRFEICGKVGAGLPL